ncbi:MAG: NHL repeat-containing protein, partial [Planctomycetota bacterium]
MKRESGKIDTNILVGVLVALAVVVGIVSVVKLDVAGNKGSGLSKEFKYDIAKLAHVDPNLIVYEESARSISTGFAAAKSIAADSEGSVYVAGDESVRIFSASGSQLDEINLAQTPGCLAVAADGAIFVGLRDHVEVYDAEGKLLTSWRSLGSDAILTSIAVSEEDVFVADAGGRVVVRYDRQGNVIGEIGRKDSARNAPGFVIPS